jgi:hypothetical protein
VRGEEEDRSDHGSGEHDGDDQRGDHPAPAHPGTRSSQVSSVAAFLVRHPDILSVPVLPNLVRWV